MELILLNSELMTELNVSNSISVLQKTYKSRTNYFFIPNIGLKLYNAKVTWIDPYKKHMSFSLSKSDNPFLVKLLHYINISLTDVYQKRSCKNNNVSPFFFEKGGYIYIRTYLPNLKGVYHIQSVYNGVSCEFVVPRKDCIFQSVTIYFKNIWEDNGNTGFNIELKCTVN